ncbi:single-stranded-DNA-specific exonuclease RecJ [Hankyongella ginsenosidimutans]|uniref:single-stranded-DNA-specific exonuclease RecJ n=1 Tax=Hankyongella ginsenosidimutans TaxID=1763828 RepID=UPI001FE60BF7|nr:single-stranded-DNA-specific exonuclease RecJ [Hankyongella ginsenosidimutans]
MPDPSIFRDMDSAAGHLADAIQAGRNIVVFGDYDVDGATSAALLLRFIAETGGIASPYIPDRLLEGYGPSGEALESLARAGAELVVTVDCGTQAFEALERAQAAGLAVIVVDHHKAGWALPPALAIVNPNRLDEAPDAAAHGHLAAVGLAFLLAVAVNRLLRQRGHYAARPEPNLLALLDLVALGTVADVAALKGLNRAFVTQGLKLMARRGNTGLAALLDVSTPDRAPRAGDLGFHLGPRINAGGRVGQSDLGVRLLTTQDPATAAGIARTLDALNEERKGIEAAVLDQALSQPQGDRPVVVAAGEGWHAGVLGIVAARLRSGTTARRSSSGWKGHWQRLGPLDCRRRSGAAVLSARDQGLLVTGGGHAMAAGLTVEAGRLEALVEFLQAALAEPVARARQDRALAIDVALAPAGATADLAEALEAAGPYGAGWPNPRVALGPVRIVKADIVGTDHLRLIVQGADGARLKAMAFRQASTALGVALLSARGQSVYLAGRLAQDDWSGGPMAELHIEDAAVCS